MSFIDSTRFDPSHELHTSQFYLSDLECASWDNNLFILIILIICCNIYYPNYFVLLIILVKMIIVYDAFANVLNFTSIIKEIIYDT